MKNPIIRITEAKVLNFPSGVGMRCTITVMFSDTCSLAVKGCLVMRDYRGKLGLLAPMYPLRRGNRVHKMRNVFFSPELLVALEAHLERTWGTTCRRFQGDATMGVPPSAIDPALPDTATFQMPATPSETVAA